MKLKIKFLPLLIIIFSVISIPNIAYAEEETKSLETTIDEMLSNIDLSGVEEYYKSLPGYISGGKTLKDFLKGIFSGQDYLDYNSILSYALGKFSEGIRARLPLFITLFVFMVISAILSATSSDKGRGVTEIARFLVFASVICTVTAISFSLLESGKEVIEKISSAVQNIFPIILTLMSITGASSSVAVYSPAVAFISNISSVIALNLIFPIIVFMLAVSVISNVNNSIKLKSLLSLCQSVLKWIIGLIVALFSVFLTVKGLSAGTFDGISLRAVKYTVNSSVPIVGGLIKDGLDFILASAVLIKNSLGIFAIIVIFGYVLTPILEIAVVTLSLKFVSAITEPLGDGRTNDFISSVSSSLNYLIATIITISVMYLALLIMVVYSSQVIL